jgi:hypothetical protein
VVKKPKYPEQNLTDEDKEILEQVVLKYAVKFYTLIEEYRNPKRHIEKILKAVQSDKNIATLYTLTYLKNYPSDHLFKPGEINQRLANDIRKAIQQGYADTTAAELEDDSRYPKRFLDPRDLREKVLKNLESHGIILNLKGKQEIKHHLRDIYRPGKRSLSNDNDRGGKPSAYKVTQVVEKLKKAMEKPGAIDFLYDKIIKSGLAHKLAKFNILAFLYAAKMDEKVFHRLMGVGASFFQDNITEKDTTNFKVIFERLQMINDYQLEQLADSIAKSAVENRGYYALLFMTGLLKL